MWLKCRGGMHACHPCTWDGKAVESRVPGQPWLHSQIPIQKKKKPKKQQQQKQPQKPNHTKKTERSMVELSFVSPTHSEILFETM